MAEYSRYIRRLEWRTSANTTINLLGIQNLQKNKNESIRTIQSSSGTSKFVSGLYRNRKYVGNIWVVNSEKSMLSLWYDIWYNFWEVPTDKSLRWMSGHGNFLTIWIKINCICIKYRNTNVEVKIYGFFRLIIVWRQTIDFKKLKFILCLYFFFNSTSYDNYQYFKSSSGC